ncbi:hypothetical protein CBOM_07805 [Ceraceosorus bombacis]|uniref:Uncharacterized protein n=1 Tax=Ceraceosorus bombacis TaxID=401625 RepID=A0A0P1BNJ6_9BASI|nr:hypothetical protein CBOM_07805 [Ceraceosorus bombacis]
MEGEPLRRASVDADEPSQMLSMATPPATRMPWWVTASTSPSPLSRFLGFHYHAHHTTLTDF